MAVVVALGVAVPAHGVDPPPWQPQHVSMAPDHAPASWIPMGEPWVVNHWLPFDEQRMYALLHTRRAEVWNWLRDDHRTLEHFALGRGWRAPALASALVAPRGSEVS